MEEAEISRPLSLTHLHGYTTLEALHKTTVYLLVISGAHQRSFVQDRLIASVASLSVSSERVETSLWKKTLKFNFVQCDDRSDRIKRLWVMRRMDGSRNIAGAAVLVPKTAFVR